MLPIEPIQPEADYNLALAETEIYFDLGLESETPEAERFDALMAMTTPCKDNTVKRMLLIKRQLKPFRSWPAGAGRDRLKRGVLALQRRVGLVELGPRRAACGSCR